MVSFWEDHQAANRAESDACIERYSTVRMICKRLCKGMCHFYVGFAKIAVYVLVAVEESFKWKDIAVDKVRCDEESSVSFGTEENRK